ncbi:acyl-CoA dehydrogenase family protein [Pendulispora albinea]|uniref:Acyl-CoA dehydrogenase family protein n=1 Tax=Pendulispora albinea TaxID=2741071 RepID=A0ABZ2M5R5_9BACT
MDFECSPQQRALYERIFRFARQELEAICAARGYDTLFGRDEMRLCGEHGLLGLCVPDAEGGGGRGLLDTALAMEALTLGAGDVGLGFAIAAHLFACCTPIAEFGNDKLRRRILPRLCSGEWIGANAITEEGAGSDVFAMTTTARREGDVYVLDGQKSFVTNAPMADVFVVFAKTNAAHGFLGITGFVVERGTPGLHIGPTLAKMGLSSIPASSIELRGCAVPMGNRIGEEGQGGVIFGRSMQWERAGLFAIWTGDMQRRLEQVIAHVKTRRQFGQRISKKQAVAHRIADMKLRLESSRLLWQRACFLLDRGTASALDVSMAKIAVSEAAIASSIDAIQLFGSKGYLQPSGVERALRDAMAATIASGTSEVQRDIIARDLGL